MKNLDFSHSDMKLIQMYDMTCLEATMATVGTYSGHHYEMIFSDMWNFNFVNNKDSGIGKKIILNNEHDHFYLFHKYHGIRTDEYTECNEKSKFELIVNELDEGHPITTHIDESFLPWPNKYNQGDGNSRYAGFLLLLDYNREDDSFVCIDVHSSKKMQTITKEQLQKGFIAMEPQMYSFDVIQEWQQEHDWLKIISEFPRSMYEKNDNAINSFDSITDFACCLQHSTLKDEINFGSYHDFYWSPFCSNLREATRSRKLLSVTLKYIYDQTKSKDLLEVSHLMAYCASKWQLALSLLYKSFYKKDFKIEQKMSMLILEASEIERNIADILSKYTEDFNCNNSDPVVATHLADEIEVKTIQVKLDHHFNNKAINYNEEVTDIDGTFRGFILDANDEGSLSLIQRHYDLWYKMTGPDNIVCCSQIIDFPKSEFSGIMLLCCAVWGEYCEKVTLEYVDGSREEQFVHFSEWSIKTPSSAEIEVFELSAFDSGLMRGIGKAYLFSQKITLPKNKMLRSLVLPDNQHCHVFSITLVG
jgi:hypothetical protein